MISMNEMRDTAGIQQTEDMVGEKTRADTMIEAVEGQGTTSTNAILDPTRTAQGPEGMI